jgi:hypothetical protein
MNFPHGLSIPSARIWIARFFSLSRLHSPHAPIQAREEDLAKYADGTTITPEGIGWTRDPKLLLHSGDTVSITIENIGTLTNPVRP